MDFLSDFNLEEEILLLRTTNKSEVYNTILEKFKNSKFVSEQDVSQKESVKAVYCEAPENILLSKILKVLAPNGKIIITNISDKETAKLELVTKGFMNVKIFDNCLTASKPSFKSGSSAQLKLPKKSAPPVWKLDDDLEDIETIDPNELLDDDDLQKPDPASLRVCGTTGKRKACKDCSCGLAEELAVEGKQGKVIDTGNAPKSSCGSCYLGDAFRCATCPYLGMPAFKAGEKIQLVGNQLQADI